MALAATSARPHGTNDGDARAHQTARRSIGAQQQKLQQTTIKRRHEQARTEVLAGCRKKFNRWAKKSSRQHFVPSRAPDKIVVHNVPDYCQACRCELPFAYVAETRQVFDLPDVKYEVTEHHAMQAICNCGQVHTAQFPADVRATVQYGPRAQAAMVHLNLNHAVSIKRTAELVKDFFGLPVSQAAVVKATQTGADILQPTVQDIGQAVGDCDHASARRSSC